MVMHNIPPPAPSSARDTEDWADADFDLPEGEPIHVHSALGRDDVEDWDLDMDFEAGGEAKSSAKASAVMAGLSARRGSTSSSSSSSASGQMITIRPPVVFDEDEDEGASTIKVAALPRFVSKPSPTPEPIEEDLEDDFAFPDDLTQLSLAPLSLSHRSSKNSLEWGDKTDHTYSSQSSDAYSMLGFADASPSSNSASSVSLVDTESEEEDDELDGLVIPTGLFESGQGGRKLTKLLELKKKVLITGDRLTGSSPDPEDDFEMGLVIDDDVDLSPSRLLLNSQHSSKAVNRSQSMPPRPPASLRPPSRLKLERSKSPVNPPPSSARQFQKLRLSPSPPLRGAPTRAQSFQVLTSAPPTSSHLTFLSPKPGSLRGQKSTSVLKPPTPPSTQRKLSRKASLSSLIEASQQASGSGILPLGHKPSSRYDAPTAASRAKAHNSTSRIHSAEFQCPPTRPSTPSSSTAALRLTMPTTSRLKTRPTLASVFSSPISTRATSPLPPRPPSSLSTRARVAHAFGGSVPTPAAPKVLRRPKRARMYGDGTELDNIDDLPTDREQEGRFRVQPSGYGNRVPGGSYPASKTGTMRRKRREGSSGGSTDSVNLPPAPTPPPTNTLKRTGKFEFPSKTSSSTYPEVVRKRRQMSSPTRRKPTLIRNLGGVGAPKVVGEMKWNPHSLRWEGNDQALRDFDAAVGTSTRPALITHLTGSSLGSPMGSFGSGARVVGTMIFDPSKMCWISTLPPDEDEPDVFANLADDEEDGDAWETKGGTIRALAQMSAGPTTLDSSSTAEGTSPAQSHTRTLSESGSERGSRASMVCDVDDDFLALCRAAEARHRIEMKGWKGVQTTASAEPDRSNLYEIRALATRKY